MAKGRSMCTVPTAPADIINISTSFEELRVSTSDAETRPAAQRMHNCNLTVVQSSAEEDFRSNVSSKVRIS
jgi:hypothetical protein